MNAIIRQSILEKKVVEFTYQGFIRIAEPHAYGSAELVDQLLVYQVRGGSHSENLPKWLTVALPGMTNFQVFDETFAGKRADSALYHISREAMYAIVR